MIFGNFSTTLPFLFYFFAGVPTPLKGTLIVMSVAEIGFTWLTVAKVLNRFHTVLPDNRSKQLMPRGRNKLLLFFRQHFKMRFHV